MLSLSSPLSVLIFILCLCSFCFIPSVFFFCYHSLSLSLSFFLSFSPFPPFILSLLSYLLGVFQSLFLALNAHKCLACVFCFCLSFFTFASVYLFCCFVLFLCLSVCFFLSFCLNSRYYVYYKFGFVSEIRPQNRNINK